MAKTYTAHAEPGQGMTLGSRVEIIKGFNAIVQYDGKTVLHGNLYRFKDSAYQEAKRQAARYRAFRQKHGEGIEDIEAKKIAARQADRRRRQRINDKDATCYDLMRLLAEDAELVREWLPAQALARIEQARAIVNYVETDPPKSVS